MNNVSLQGRIVGPSIEGGIYTGATCLAMDCDSDSSSVLVTIGSVTFPCPSNSVVDLSTLSFSPAFAPNSEILCPDYPSMCSTDPSPVEAAVFGLASCSALSECNNNGDCYKGVCYCKVGWTGAFYQAPLGYFNPVHVEFV